MQGKTIDRIVRAEETKRLHPAAAHQFDVDAGKLDNDQLPQVRDEAVRDVVFNAIVCYLLQDSPHLGVPCKPSPALVSRSHQHQLGIWLEGRNQLQDDIFEEVRFNKTTL